MTKAVVRGSKKNKAAAMQQRKHLAYLREEIGRNHNTWIRSHPSGTLADLREFLDAVRDEFYHYDEDELLTGIFGELDQAADYLEDFVPVDEDMTGNDELATVGYRTENVEEDIRLLDDLIGEVGGDYKVRLLPKWKK